MKAMDVKIVTTMEALEKMMPLQLIWICAQMVKKKDDFLQGNHLASHHLSELNCIVSVEDNKIHDLDLRKNDNAKDDFPKKNDFLAACVANTEFSVGEDEATKANLDLHNDFNEKDDFNKTNDLASCINSKKLCAGEDDCYLLDSKNVDKK